MGSEGFRDVKAPIQRHCTTLITIQVNVQIIDIPSS